jgi:hypothetical protein
MRSRWSDGAAPIRHNFAGWAERSATRYGAAPRPGPGFLFQLVLLGLLARRRGVVGEPHGDTCSARVRRLRK